ncbi:MAG: SDR family oxidoreductase [Marmoricola sp.]
MRVAVLGGTGKTGRPVCAAVGAGAVPLGRAAWADLPGALAGCDAAYVIAPNMHPDEASYVADVVSAAHTAGVRRVVLHSVASPYVPEMPHHLGKAAAEDVVRRSGLAWTILQPGPYLQNFGTVRFKKHPGPLDPGASWTGPSSFRVAYRPDAPFGFADLADVAEVAATVLRDDGHEGTTYELATLRATVAELAETLGVHVETITPEEWARTDGADLDPRVRDWLLAMFGYYDRHGLPVGTLPMRALLGRLMS